MLYNIHLYNILIIGTLASKYATLDPLRENSVRSWPEGPIIRDFQ